jgi:hypothetical protein
MNLRSSLKSSLVAFLEHRAAPTIMLLGTFVLVMLVKTPHIFLTPRLWAEEGTRYLNSFQTLGATDSMLLVVNANYQFLLNLIVLIASRLPMAWAAHVTTYVSFAVAILVAYQLQVFAREFALQRYVALLLVLMWALLAHTYEVFATATNLQWVCSISVLLLCTSSLSSRSKGSRYFVYGWVVACGLTGVASCVLALGFFLRTLLDKSRPHLVIGILLTVCSVLQLWIIATHETIVPRSFTRDIELLVLPTLLNTIAEPLIGARQEEQLVNAIQPGVEGAGAVKIVLETATTSVIVFLTLALRNCARNRRVAFLVVVVLWAFASVIYTFGAIGDPRTLLLLWSGARYYLLGAVAFGLMLALATGASNGYARTAAIWMLSFLVVISAVDIIMPSSLRYLYSHGGPSWSAELARCGAQRPCRVKIWPHSDIWTVDLLR